MSVSFADIQAVKRGAKKLRSQFPDSPHTHLLTQAAQNLFGVRDFHELQRHREKTINQYLILSDGIATCAYCGFSFCPGLREEDQAHRERHDTYEEAVTVMEYKPLLHAEREVRKKEGYILLSETVLERQKKGALLIIRAWFDRSLESAIYQAYWKQHPKFEDYVSYLVGDLGFPYSLELQASLEQEYGRVDGPIPKGRSYWSPSFSKN